MRFTEIDVQFAEIDLFAETVLQFAEADDAVW